MNLQIYKKMAYSLLSYTVLSTHVTLRLFPPYTVKSCIQSANYNVRYLVLRCSGWTDATVPNCSHLDISETYAVDSVIKHLDLVYLNARWSNITADGCAHMSRLTTLKINDVTGVSKLTNLTSLAIASEVYQNELSELSTLTLLTKLDLYNNLATDLSSLKVAKLSVPESPVVTVGTTYEKLNVSYCGSVDLSNLIQCKYLDITGCIVTDAQLSRLVCKELCCSDTSLSGGKYLMYCEHIIAHNTNFTDATLQYLTNCRHLEIDTEHITGTGFKYLTNLTSLVITDGTIDGMMFKHFTNLKHLKLNGAVILGHLELPTIKIEFC